MYKQIFIAALLTGAMGKSVRSQEMVTDEPRRFRYYFNGGFGFYFPQNQSLGLNSSGSINSANFQVNYRNNYFLRFSFDQLNIKYKREGLVNGVSTRIDSKVQSSQFALDLGYTFPIRRFSPYVFGGGGAALMDVPTIKPDLAGNQVSYVTSSKTFGMFKAGAGLEFEVSRIFILYLESQFQSIPYETDLDKKKLEGFTLLLGFKTPLQ